MKNISSEICRRIGDARRACGISQSALARELGCKQPAISMFEAGDGTKLSEETILKLAARFNISLEEAPTPEKTETILPAVTSAAVGFIARRPAGYCPSCDCLSNIPYVVCGRLYFQAAPDVAAPFAGAKRCAVCGEVLETCCPGCGAVLNAGACCGVCGLPYVTPAVPEGIDTVAWARMRRNEIAELRALKAL